jgi:hypothetical protein
MPAATAEKSGSKSTDEKSAKRISRANRQGD